MAGTFTITGMSAGEPAGERVVGPITITGAVVVGETLSVQLASGDNTISVPTGSVAVMIRPPTNGTTTIKFRTSLNSSDAGLPLNSATTPFVYRFPSTAPTSLILHASAAMTGFVTVMFI